MKKTQQKFKRILWLIKNIFHKYSKEEKETIKENKKLIKEFPFLLPRNRFFDTVIYNYDYTYTELDEMPHGWKSSFGIEMCEEIKKCLIKVNYLYKYRIIQIKEKYGTLVWYDNGVPTSIYEEICTIINYYEDKSMLICSECGDATKYVTTGWIEYLCEEHFKKRLEKNTELNYQELTWANIPVRYAQQQNATIKIESELKGEMMCNWKRYSKYNNTILKSKLNELEEIEKNSEENFKKNGLW